MNERLEFITRFSEFDIREKYIYFHNDTSLPVMIDSWIEYSNQLYCRKIEAGQKLIVHSSVGEWHLNIMFPNNDDSQLWKENEQDFTRKSNLLGKFRSLPSAFGDYSWMEYDDPFYCEYNKIEPDENKILGVIRFYKKV